MVNTERLCLGCMNDNGGEQVCPICGFDNSADNSKEHLKTGTWLNANRYYVGKVIEEAGDGVTYIGWDNDRNAVVNIKEYFPAGIAVRSDDRLTVTPAEERGLIFNQGKEDFTKLFKDLYLADASLAVLRVEDVFEAGGTMYAVQSTVSGHTLKEFLIRNGGSLKWEQAKPLFMPLISTVAALNDMGIYHRGICLDNIIVGRDGKLRLTGFCIKSVLTAHSEFLSQLPSGFAAPEQYLETTENFATCDVYALGAVLFRTLIGTTPPDAKDRLANDKLAIPTKVTETVPRGALVAMANALKVDPLQRVGSADRLYKMFEAVAGLPVVTDEENEPEEKKTKAKTSVIYAVIAVAATAIILAVLFIVFALPAFKDNNESSKPTSVPSTPSTITSSASSGYVPDAVLFEVPNLLGEVYADVYGELQTDFAHFDFVVAGRMPSDTVPRGAICQQSIEKGSRVERDTKIELYISQGPDKLKMPDVKGKNWQEGMNEFFKAGFYVDAVKFEMGQNADVKPGEIYEVIDRDGSSIRAGAQVSINDLITVYYNDPNMVVDSSSEESSSNTPTTQQ